MFTLLSFFHYSNSGKEPNIQNEIDWEESARGTFPDLQAAKKAIEKAAEKAAIEWTKTMRLEGMHVQYIWHFVETHLRDAGFEMSEKELEDILSP